MATKKPTGRKPKRGESSNAAGLIRALKFVSAAQQKEGTAYQTHCVFHDNFVTAYDGKMVIGHPVEESITVAPNTLKLLDALQKCGDDLSITKVDSGRLNIASGKMKVNIPCAVLDSIPFNGPDAPCATIDDRLLAGFEIVGKCAGEDEKRPVLQSILMQANTVVGTNSHVLIEYWHGIDLPPDILLPKAAVKAICGAGKKLAKFGFTSNSATFFFEDGSYIKTQLFADKYPSYLQLFNRNVNLLPLPEDFYNGVSTLISFCDDDYILFDEGVMSTHIDVKQAATFEVEGLPGGLAFNPEYLMWIKSALHSIDFGDGTSVAIFQSENVRGALMPMNIKGR